MAPKKCKKTRKLGDFEVGFGDLITPPLAKGGYPGTSQGCQLSNDARGKSSSQLEKILRRKEKKNFFEKNFGQKSQLQNKFK